MERLEETLFMGFWVEPDEIVVQIPNKRIIAGSDVMKRRVFNHVSAITHGILDAFDRVARRAGESGLCGRRMEVLPNRFVHHAVEEDCWVVTAAAPFRGLDAVDFLHIDD